nr:hypothetical protein [Leptolyngbya sp. FACHB-1624]
MTDAGYTVQNVDDMGWRGLKDREILNLAEAYPFDVFITADKNLCYQQNLTQRALILIVLNSSSTRPDHLVPLILKLIPLLPTIALGTAIAINDAGEVTQIHP